MIKYIAYLYLIAFFCAGCSMPDDLNRPGDKLTGYITHIDTNLMLSGGFYSVSVYNAELSDPFNKVPVRTDSMKLTRRDALYESSYDMDGIAPGKYHVASTWSRYPRVENEVPIVLGTYGCDTSASCTDHKIIVYPNLEGNFRNITSWTDLAKALN